MEGVARAELRDGAGQDSTSTTPRRVVAGRETKAGSFSAASNVCMPNCRQPGQWAMCCWAQAVRFSGNSP